jgi:protein-tyrosine phosphatase
MAEAVARAEIVRRGWSHVRVRSAGVAADPGSAATPEAQAVARRQGLDLSTHRATLLDQNLVDWADIILAMSPSHLWSVATMGGENKAALLGEFAAGDEGQGAAVPDPFGGAEAEYEATLIALSGMVRASLDRLSAILSP